MYQFADMSVPGKTKALELETLARLAASVPPGGVIVEVGPLYGRSTVAMARAAPHARIYSIDTWEMAPWIERYEQTLPGCHSFSLDAFRHYTRDYPNVTPIQGMSPDIVGDWREPVDLYFEDATHGNPGLAQNLNYWTQRLKPGGVLWGHDYTLRFPDVKREADARAQQWQRQIEVVESLWAMRTPDAAPDARLYDSLPAPPTQGLRVLTSNKRSGKRSTPPWRWAGAHLEADRLVWFALQWERKIPDLQVEYRVRNMEFGESEWVGVGEKAMIEKDGKRHQIDALAMRLTGPRASEYAIHYRGAFRQIGNEGHKLSGVGEWGTQGGWSGAPKTPGAPMCSLSVIVQHRDEPSLVAMGRRLEEVEEE